MPPGTTRACWNRFSTTRRMWCSATASTAGRTGSSTSGTMWVTAFSRSSRTFSRGSTSRTWRSGTRCSGRTSFGESPSDPTASFEPEVTAKVAKLGWPGLRGPHPVPRPDVRGRQEDHLAGRAGGPRASGALPFLPLTSRAGSLEVELGTREVLQLEGQARPTERPAEAWRRADPSSRSMAGIPALRAPSDGLRESACGDLGPTSQRGSR